MAGVGGLVVVSARLTGDSSSPSASNETTGSVAPVDSTMANGDGTGSTDTVGTVAPPVTVHIETADDDHADGSVLADYTVVDPPEVPEITAALDSSWIKNGVITTKLPDGYYWAYIDSSSDEPTRTVTFDVRQTFFGIESCRAHFGDAEDACLNDYGVDESIKGLLEVSIDSLIFVSLPILEISDGQTSSRSISPTNWWPLVNGELSTVMIPGEEVQAIVSIGPYLLTVIDGDVVAAEGIRVP